MKSGLGNNLFIFAHFIGFSKEHKIKILNPAFIDGVKYFGTLNRNFWGSYPYKNNYVHNISIRQFLYKLINLASRILTRLNISNKLIGTVDIGWENYLDIESDAFLKKHEKSHILLASGWKFRANNYVQKYKNEILDFFQPLPYHQKNITDFISKARVDCNLLIGVHIRYGDYRHMWNGSHFFSLEEFKNVMENLIDIFPQKKIRFILCSNEQLDYNIFRQLDFIQAPGHELEDMYILSKCDYIIGPHSSYSLWASYYGNVPLHVLRHSLTKIKETDFSISDISD